MDKQLEKLTERLKNTKGKEYYSLLNQIFQACGDEIVREAKEIMADSGRITPVDIGVICVRYNINVKAVVEYLEKREVIPCGIYDKLQARGIKATDILYAARMILNS